MSRVISEQDWQQTVELCRRLSLEVRRLKNERSKLRGWLRWALARLDANVPGIYISTDIRALAMRGRR